MSDTIHCPQCNFEIEVAEALSAQLRSDLQQQFETELKSRQAVIDQREAAITAAQSRLAEQEQELSRRNAAIEDRVAAELAERISVEQERIAKEAADRARQQLALELQDKELALKDQEQQLADAARKLKEAKAAELALLNERRALQEQREQLELTITRCVDEERAKAAQRELLLAREKAQLESELAAKSAEVEERVESELAARIATEQKRIAKEAEDRARQQLALELQDKELALKDQEAQLAEAARKLKEAKAAELALLNERRALQEQREQLELTVTRRVDEERAKALEAGQRLAAEQMQLKIDEAEKRSRDLLKQLEEAQRKAAQGSQQLQGEVLELSLESSLRQQFPDDDVEPVAKGIHGGDIVQTVRDGFGNNCGDILWESKRTKNWSDQWLPKLRDDQRAAKAQLAVLATMELPKGCSTFRCIDGVWVTSMPCALSVAAALRAWMIEVAAAKRAQEGRHSKSDQLYGYITGPEFRHRFEGVLESFVTMRAELDQERRAMQRAWAKRDKQIERGIEQAVQLHGNLEGILGGALPAPPQLVLPAPEDDGNGDASTATGGAFALLSAPPTPTRKRRSSAARSVEREE